LTQAIPSLDASRNGLLMVAAAGVFSGMLTPLMPPLVDFIGWVPAFFGTALVAIPFAILVFILVWRASANPTWAAVLAAILTMVAFICAVKAAIYIDGELQATGVTKTGRNILAGVAGGFTGATLMALGMAMLPSGPRDAVVWVPMVLAGTLLGALLAVDNALYLDLTLVSVLYPVWQAGVAATLVMALQRAKLP
jgi:hypothetical protein